MSHRARLTRRLGAVAAAATAVALTFPVTAHAAPIPAVPHAAAGAHSAVTRYTVTLVTGDTVHVTEQGGGKYAVQVHKGKGREHITFVTNRTKDGLSVVPADALKPLAQGRLDARLFNVTLLKKWKYDDAHTAELPLMTSAAGTAKVAPGALPGSRSVRALPSIGVTSVRERKADAGTFWASLTAARKSAAAAAIGKVWLVGKLQPTLDVSVPQVRAPEAWAHGNTGKGATVAVVDTGVDANHPDLKGVVTDAKDFTGSEFGTKDEVGHGTHVAGTIAGRGTASNGKYTGVAKGAEIKSAKVCVMDGCPEDAILAGMTWAADSGAKVINMSLGGPPAETADVLEQAVNGLSADKNVLFVIAAGNDGMPESIGSPGTADAALTVGSVDKVTDELSFYSSQGPRVTPSRRSDYAIKPDITAPGRDIVAPRAAGTLEEEKVGEDYARLSGTSMATPHVAGGAAILAAQHPDWNAAEIKSSLMSSAKVIAGQTVYQQGAGRLDVGRASDQSVTATGSASLGYFPWPNKNAPTGARTVTYANHGTTPVTLNLALSVAGPDGKPAPAKMFGISAKKVTVPAAGTASITATVNPNAGPAGLYSGDLTATTADGKTTVHTAVGADKEAESYNISYTAIGREPGRFGATATFVNLATGEGYFDYVESAGTKRVPAGDYLVISANFDETTDGRFQITYDAQKVKVNKSTELVFDARRGKPVKLSFDAPKDAELYGEDISIDSSGFGSGTLGAEPGSVYGVPRATAIPGVTWSLMGGYFKKGTWLPGAPPTPYTYDFGVSSPGKLPANATFTEKKANMAQVTAAVDHQSADEHRDLAVMVSPGGSGMAIGAILPLGDRYDRVDYVSTGHGTTAETDLFAGTLAPEGYNQGEYITGSMPVAYKAGQKATIPFNRGVFGPAAGDGFATRRDNHILAFLPMLSARDQFGGAGYTDTATAKLTRDGVEIGQSPWPGVIDADIPAGNGTYRIDATVDRTPAYATLSRHVAASWTFTSAQPASGEVADLALQAVRFTPVLDHDNKAAAGAFSVPLSVERAPNSGNGTVKNVTVEVSYDGGKTWTAAPLTGSGTKRVASVTNPAGGTVSLRATAADSAGNTVTQTIVNAYLVK
ncbi:MAG: hypothetical protein QOI35_1186 [Cryptosporangiaceae bacterium]|nr:hypothetical protein [Cryptosporangiaceae bacterium]